MIVLARHAAHADVGVRLSGRSAIGLSEDGHAQARAMAQRLGRYDITAVHSSPLRRARETAAAAAERLGLDVKVSDALDEVDFGAWTGSAFADLARDSGWQHWNVARGSTRPPGGETMPAATARAVAHVDATADRQSGATLLVSHCDIIRGIVAHYLGLALDNLLRFEIDPASLTTLAIGSGSGRLLTLNERA